MIIIINYLIDSHYEHTTSTNLEDLGSTSSVGSIPVVLVVVLIATAIALLLVVIFAILLVRYRQRKIKKMNMQV